MALTVLALFCFVVPKEWMNKLNPAGWKHTEIPLAYEHMVQNFNIHDSLVEKKDQLLNEISKANIETRILQEEIISAVHGHCMDNNIVITKIIFSEISPVNFNDEEISGKSDDAAAVTVGVSVEFKGSLDDVLNVIGDIKGDVQDIGFSNMRLLSMHDSDIMGVMDLNFYAMPLDIR